MSIYKMSKEAERQAIERLASGVRERAKRERAARMRSEAVDVAMSELCARLREHFECAGHPVCPDPECGELDGQHVPGCAYAAYVEAQDAVEKA